MSRFYDEKTKLEFLAYLRGIETAPQESIVTVPGSF